MKKGHNNGGREGVIIELTKNGRQVGVFETAADCSRWLGLHRTSVSKAIREGRTTIVGYGIKVATELDLTLWQIKESNKHYEFTRP